MLRREVFCGLAGLLFTVMFAAEVEAAAFVETVKADVESGQNLPPLIERRMETTVSAIGAQLLEGRRISEAEASRANDEKVIREVFDKVLVGYSVQSVRIEPAEETHVFVSLIPWADVIRKVNVDITVEGMSPAVEPLVRRDLADVGQVFERGLSGLPEAATDWTNGVLKRSLNEYLDEHLPEFRGDFEILSGEETSVKLVVYPRLPVIRTVDLSMRSDSIPNLTLLNHRAHMQESVNTLIGVPVSFVKRHSAEFEAMFAKDLDSMDDFRALSMHTEVKLFRISEDLAVMSRSNTEKYLIRLEGWTDISRRGDKDEHTVFRLHVGRRFTPQDEIFLQTDFLPHVVEWKWDVGYARHFTPWTRAIVRYDLKKDRFVLGGEQAISDRWMLRYEYRWADQKGEAAVRYRMHDFLSFEYAVDKDDNWLRVIGNF